MIALLLSTAFLAMQAGGLPPLQFSDVATSSDGTVYAVDGKAIRTRNSDRGPLRTATVRVTYSATANADYELAVRGYYVNCDARTAGMLSSINTARGTKRLSMERTRIEELVYRPFTEMELAEQTTMEFICAAKL